jgi:cysteine synthase A
MGHPCFIAADRAISSDLLAGIEARGARVCFIDAPTNATNVQELRKRLRDDLAREHDAFVPDQYDNPANPESYRAAAEIVGAAIGSIDVLVTSVGSGGSSRGLAVLRDLHPLHVVAVDTFGSILFGLPAGPRDLRGLGNGIMPGNLDHAIFNEVHWVTQEIALEGVLRIEEAGLGGRGLTSGAAWMVAEFIATSCPQASVLAVFPDLGWRYQQEVAPYRLRRNPSAPLSPARVGHPGEAQPPWSWMSWDRRTLAAIRGSDRTQP